MIILDTNVLSALMRDSPEPAVISWLDAQPSESIWTTSITVFEIRTGLDLLDASRRRQRLQGAFEQLIADDLDGRVLAFDTMAAQAASTVVARRQRAGRSLEIPDARIAGSGLARKATLATGNTKQLVELQVPLVDPWHSTYRAPCGRTP